MLGGEDKLSKFRNLIISLKSRSRYATNTKTGNQVYGQYY